MPIFSHCAPKNTESYSLPLTALAMTSVSHSRGVESTLLHHHLHHHHILNLLHPKAAYSFFTRISPVCEQLMRTVPVGSLSPARLANQDQTPLPGELLPTLGILPPREWLCMRACACCHNKNQRNNQNQDRSYPTGLSSMPQEPQEMPKLKLGAIREREPELALKTRPPGLGHAMGQAPSGLPAGHPH